MWPFEIISPEKLVEHDLDVVAGVPVAVVIKAAGLCNCGMGSAECGIAALASPARTDRFQIVAAINDAGVGESGGFGRLCSGGL